jgi:polar amino acid transport system substrate-binding protein
MVWTRRRLLTNLGLAVASGGAALAGCSTTVVGAPRESGVPSGRRGAGPTTSSRRTPRRGALRVAVPQGEPYAFNDGSGRLTGHTVEIVRAVLTTLEFDDVEFSMEEFQTIIPRLVTGQFDIAAGLYLTKGQCQGLTWSVPDHIGLTALAVPPGNPKGLGSFADVIEKGATVVVMTGLPEDQYATKNVSQRQLIRHPSPIEMLQSVATGRADCAAFPDLGLRSLIKGGIGDSGNLEVTAPFVLDGIDLQVSAHAFNREIDEDLIGDFDDELLDMQKSGEWLAIAERFGFTAEHLPNNRVDTGQYCGV